MPNWGLALIAVTSVAGTIGLATAVIVIPGMHAERTTADRVYACHALRGTARLDRRGIYSGCLIPSERAP
jgi:hypothetical protein